jgi:hypothetical protein
MDSYRLYALALHNPNFLFGQPVKLADQGVYLALEGSLFMRCTSLLERFYLAGVYQ